MKITPKTLTFFDAVNQQLNDIGDGIAKGIQTWLFCESFETTTTGVRFHLFQYGCRGGDNEHWVTISVTFEDLQRDDVSQFVANRFKAKKLMDKQQAEEQKVARERQQELDMLAKLQEKYGHKIVDGNTTPGKVDVVDGKGDVIGSQG